MKNNKNKNKSMKNNNNKNKLIKRIRINKKIIWGSIVVGVDNAQVKQKIRKQQQQEQQLE